MIAGWGKKALSWSTVALERISDWLPAALAELQQSFPAEAARMARLDSMGSGGFFQAVEKLNGGADDR